MAMEMVLRASCAPAPSLLHSSSPVSSSYRILSNVSKRNPKSQLKLPRSSSPGRLPYSATLSLLALFTTPLEAKAFSIAKDQIVSSLTQVEQTIDQVQEVGSGFLDKGQQVLGAIAETLKPGIDAALPFLQQAGEEALKVASPAMSEATKKVQEAIQSAGFDTEPVAQTVTTAAQQTTRVIEVAKPIASSTVETISNSDPIVIAEATGALFLVYLLIPPIWSAITFNFRGYRGALTPAQTLDLLCSQSHILIDIRSEKDKNKAGVPRLPPSAKNRVIAIPIEELPSKLRGLVRNTRTVEAEIAALKISYLKRISKGSNIVVMDSYADSARIVAKTLTSLGFKNSWIMTDGFSGSKGWLQSRLGTESYNLTFGEIFSPSRIIPAGVGRFSTGSSTVQSS